LLVTATLLVHGWSLGDGLFLDDHWHQAQLRQRGWSLDLLFDATTIEPSRFIELWWQDKPAVWRYARPASVALMKLVCDLSDGSAAAQHAVSLALHLLTVWMVYRLCLLLTGHRGWSTVGGLLFAVYVHSIFAVGWIAAQNGVLQTCLCVAALLAYVRASGLNVGPGPSDDARGEDDAVEAARPSWMILTWVLWLVALGARENAVVMPLVFIAFDLAFAGRRQIAARLAVHVPMLAVATAYSYWRLAIFAAPMPDVYVRRPDGDLIGYVLWCAVKLLHYLCSAVWHSPMTIGPSGRVDPIREAPGDCLLMLGIVAGLAVGYFQAARGLRGRWIWPLWLVLSLLPVTPVLATPHSGYMAGVGFAVGAILPAALIGLARPVGIRRWARGVAVFFLVATCCYTPIYRALWRSMLAAERITIEEWERDAPPPPTVTDVFLINVPFVNVYAGPCMNALWPGAAPNVRNHTLTFSPELLGVESACTLRRIDEYTLEAATAGRPYFSGLLGRFLIGGLRRGGALAAGESIETEHFTARVTAVAAGGVSSIQFRFRQPLDSPRYRFYFSSAVCNAMPIRFAGRLRRKADGAAADSRLETRDARPHNAAALLDRLREGEAGAAVGWFDLIRQGADVPAEQQRRFRSLVEPIAVATGQDPARFFPEPGRIEVEPLERWWIDLVDDDTLAHVSMARDTLAPLRRQRGRLAAIRSTAARIIRTDLYLTGPPYDVSTTGGL